MRCISFKLAGITLLLNVVITFAQKPLYKDPKQPVEARVQDLLKRMTPEEKFWQCFMIPGDLDNVPKGQYSHGIFGLQVSAGNQGGGVAGQLLKYNANEDAERLVKKSIPFRNIS
ncbi:hypothetical protein [Chryseobacterium sp. CH21]|uniref:hypothetical protein n=1 Tax=Chryseobacterium sp. CH21 TaxID=713556 RepID=UPI001E28A1F0|nr:hypothetical protein [Chryseobacterium sp. CH21]